MIVMQFVPATISKALAHIRREWSQGHLRSIRLSELAQAADVSTGHFARQFRTCYGVGAATALERLRLARAATMLRSARQPLAEVAVGCGFADAYHFSRRFSAVYGLPPGRCRRQGLGVDVNAPLAEAGLLAMAATIFPPTAIEQAANTSAPPGLRKDRTYGQSFTVPWGLHLSEVRLLLATYGSTSSAVTVNLYRHGAGAGRALVASKRIEPMTDNTTEWLSFPVQENGVYYLELTEPRGTPTWWWHQGSDVARVGGSAFIDGNPVQHTNFIFSATAVGTTTAADSVAP
jgi:AraC-like DNA-binding protein